MYLRTTQRKNKDGSVTKYYQLAHNERHPVTGKATARIIHSFGRADQLDRESLVRLCRSIARVCGVEVIDPMDGSSLMGGLPQDVKILRTVDFGTVKIVESLWEQYRIGSIFRQVAKKKQIPYETALLAMVANRLCTPESKLGVWDRWLETVYLPDCDELQLHHMYEAMDIFHQHAEQVEREIFYNVANLLNLTVDIIFYDTTTASFAVDYEDVDGLRQYGHAKEGMWAPQVVVALAVTREGIPVKSWVFPGNTADVSTVKKIKKDLRGWNLGRALFVADSGMNSETNREELARACGTYLLATRMASVKEIKETVLSQPGRYRELSENLHAKEVALENGKRYIVCYNPAEARRQATHREDVVTMLEDELKRHKDKSATKKWAITLLGSRRYKRYLAITDKGKIRIDRKAIKAAARYDGKWVLETNDNQLSLEDAAYGYRSLMVIERCFRSLKRTQIKMMPMYHWAERRIESHVKICVLALFIERVAELKCGKPWSQIKRISSKIQATEFAAPDHVFYQLNELPKGAKTMLKNLSITRPHKVFGIKTVKKGAAIT
ncbi:MAG TPA: IS1634 family transposase [Desulfobulbaceae bacterium]|nr:IS1634 family transposase [Desulfobulbaceae bacterium]